MQPDWKLSPFSMTVDARRIVLVKECCKARGGKCNYLSAEMYKGVVYWIELVNWWQ